MCGPFNGEIASTFCVCFFLKSHTHTKKNTRRTNKKKEEGKKKISLSSIKYVSEPPFSRPPNERTTEAVSLASRGEGSLPTEVKKKRRAEGKSIKSSVMHLPKSTVAQATPDSHDIRQVVVIPPLASPAGHHHRPTSKVSSPTPFINRS